MWHFLSHHGIDMNQHNELILRLSFFFGMLCLMLIWELVAPKRTLSISKPNRWFNNLAVVVIDSVIVRLLFPAAAVGVAIYAQQHTMGLFNVIELNPWFVVIASVLVLDLAIYFQHVMFHAVPLFWRIHRMHHVDLDFDTTTGIRFHPIEIILSLLIKFCVILLIGAPIISVIIFEIILNATSLFNHGNVRMPLMLDRVIRWFIVTPDMHRVHHSVIPNETNSNFGFNLSVWDRLFGTYTAQPRLGHEKMSIGINSIRDMKYCVNVLGMLWVPFLRDNKDYSVNRRRSKEES